MLNKPLENKPGRGVLFRRRADGNKPTLSGGVNIDGTEYELAGWEQTSKAGKDYISLTIKPVTQQREAGRWQP
jgi:uncharacterized protein (DUF736 family)